MYGCAPKISSLQLLGEHPEQPVVLHVEGRDPARRRARLAHGHADVHEQLEVDLVAAVALRDERPEHAGALQRLDHVVGGLALLLRLAARAAISGTTACTRSRRPAASSFTTRRPRPRMPSRRAPRRAPARCARPSAPPHGCASRRHIASTMRWWNVSERSISAAPNERKAWNTSGMSTVRASIVASR